MKRTLQALVILALMATAGVRPAAAQNRYIVRTNGGLSSVLRLCLSANCQVQGSLDGQVGQTFLVTSTGNLLTTLLNGTLNLLESLLGIQSVEADRLLPIPLKPLNTIPPGLNDNAPVNYYGTVVWHGYAVQPATQITRLGDAQRGFNVSGTGIVAVIDTGVPPILDHRVVTLHPKIHGGILADRSKKTHDEDMATYGIEPFDLVVSNLYPFAQDPGIETIDVGGPAMVRAAAKNHAFVTTVTDASQYAPLLEEMDANDNTVGDDTRRAFAVAAFVPFGAPAYVPVAATALAALRRGGEPAIERWLWVAPVLYVATVHAACILFGSAVLPPRRLQPDLRFDGLVLAASYAYVALTRLAKPIVVRKDQLGDR